MTKQHPTKHNLGDSQKESLAEYFQKISLMNKEIA